MEKTFSDLIKDSIAEEEKKLQDEEVNAKKINFSFENFKNKLKRNFFAGFGIGLVVAALAFFLFQPLTKEEIKNIKDKKVEEMSNAEIIERAKALGMEFPLAK